MFCGGKSYSLAKYEAKMNGLDVLSSLGANLQKVKGQAGIRLKMTLCCNTFKNAQQILNLAKRTDMNRDSVHVQNMFLGNVPKVKHERYQAKMAFIWAMINFDENVQWI